MNELDTKIIEAFRKVFDENGQVTPCGRDKCIILIEALNEKFPKVDFGDARTGFLNVSNVKEYMEKI